MERALLVVRELMRANGKEPPAALTEEMGQMAIILYAMYKGGVEDERAGKVPR